MKEYRTYRNIRKRAQIIGLPVSLFALQMMAVIVSLLIIIFSFGLLVVIGTALFNVGLYLGLHRLARNTHFFELGHHLPKSISNQPISGICYEDH